MAINDGTQRSVSRVSRLLAQHAIPRDGTADGDARRTLILGMAAAYEEFRRQGGRPLTAAEIAAWRASQPDPDSPATNLMCEVIAQFSAFDLTEEK